MKKNERRRVIKGAVAGLFLGIFLAASTAGAEQNATTNATGEAKGKGTEVCLEFERNPFEPPDVSRRNVKIEEKKGLRTVGGKDEVQWTVPPGTEVPKIKVTGLMRAERGVAACARVTGLGAVILKPEQRVMLTGEKGVSWFDVEEISGRELTIILDSGARVKGSFF